MKILIFRYDLVEQLKKFSNLPSGKIEILSNQIPFTSMRPYELDYLLFKAYGKRVWHVRFVDSKTNIASNKYDYVKFYKLDDIVADCKITFKFFNEIDQLERFKSLYIFKFKDYFRMKLLHTTC